VGRGIHLGDTIFGLKGRVAFEAPAAAVLITCHRELEKLVLTAKAQRVKDVVAQTYGDLVHEAQYFEPACRDIEALFVSSQARVSGEVSFSLRPGSIFVEGVSSPYSLKHASKGVYGEAAGEWTAADARGFSRLWGLPSMLYARAAGGTGKGPVK
jgi:argininosuccinate synthase